MYDDSRDDTRSGSVVDASDYVVDIREYDVPYHVRVAIDKGRVIMIILSKELTIRRHPSWKMVHGRGKTWICHAEMYRGTITTSGASGAGI